MSSRYLLGELKTTRYLDLSRLIYFETELLAKKYLAYATLYRIQLCDCDTSYYGAAIIFHAINI